jgi:hypothetical protein
MSNLVSLDSVRNANRVLLVCQRCQCRSFFVYADGKLGCCNCDQDMSTDVTEWIKVLPAPDNPPVGNLDTGVIQNFGARRAVETALKKIDHDTLAALIIVHYTGRCTHWGQVYHEQDEKQWLTDRVNWCLEAILSAPGTRLTPQSESVGSPAPVAENQDTHSGTSAQKTKDQE